jgi:hypothetical protein
MSPEHEQMCNVLGLHRCHRESHEGLAGPARSGPLLDHLIRRGLAIVRDRAEGPNYLALSFVVNRRARHLTFLARALALSALATVMGDERSPEFGRGMCLTSLAAYAYGGPNGYYRVV